MTINPFHWSFFRRYQCPIILSGLKQDNVPSVFNRELFNPRQPWIDYIQPCFFLHFPDHGIHK